MTLKTDGLLIQMVTRTGFTVSCIILFRNSYVDVIVAVLAEWMIT